MEEMISFAIKEKENVKFNEINKKFNRFMKIHSFKNPVFKYVLTHKYYKILLAQQYEDSILEEGWQKQDQQQRQVEHLAQLFSQRHLKRYHYWTIYIMIFIDHDHEAENQKIVI
ncbi:hypothetical protein TTHERM_00328480 (macronuclear) [Tetrahymena thermophila SB210]|uniref:Uncharacterized protein n=1 Tax=Tetrahymena thermophila (strain SB210) TaxID=312017 RepID=I7M4D4_TETTS|nr:hypothetical protein TTHERM_00328480 [Tetrahymena thermophila SB210]EAS06267.1 hypothetical protein TTHERM_00328480 [Tetrahymena thermophila SB210]|eukprot:XP_001026512.1 hypothetical protein TTHERM_00328480 [Tetrahymena thermophila SB210]